MATIESLLTDYPALQIVTNPYIRFYLYKRYPTSLVPDIDRSQTMMTIYAKLGWYHSTTDSEVLEPDTFFASPHYYIRKIFKAYDQEYYLQNFRSYCLNRGIDFDHITQNDYFKPLRYEWMIEPSTINHYFDIIQNKAFQRYIHLAHTVGNFLIVPKHFGTVKCHKYQESFVQGLTYLEKHFDDEKSLYGLADFTSFKTKFLLEELYDPEDTFTSIIVAENALLKEGNTSIFLKTLPLINDFIEKRGLQILSQLESK